MGENAIGQVFQRTYHVAPNKLGTIPSRGDLLPEFEGGATSDLLKPRITNIKYVQQRRGAFQDIVLSFLQPVILSGGLLTDDFKELRNSRVRQPGQYRTDVVMVGICSDITHADVPTTGDTFPGDEAENLPRMCFAVRSDPNPLPGLFVITARFRGSIGA